MRLEIFSFVFFFFFFQAEDGIRDGTVTGVQTCALPIWPTSSAKTRIAAPPSPENKGALLFSFNLPATDDEKIQLAGEGETNFIRLERTYHVKLLTRTPGITIQEIGRASCRERV